MEFIYTYETVLGFSTITFSSFFCNMRYLGLGGRKNIPIPWITAGIADRENIHLLQGSENKLKICNQTHDI